MSFTTFYIQSGGSNANSGTTSSNTPVWSNAANVTWVGTTTSTLATTDLNAVNVLVGDYINVGGTWVSKVTANSGNVGGTVTITLSGTTGWGTEPSGQTYSTHNTVIDGGAWLDLTQGIITGSTTVPSSTMICVAQSMSLILGGALTVGLKSATTAPIWYRGYNTSVGDLDNGSTTLSYPTINQGANQVTWGSSTGSQGHITSGFSFSGSNATPFISASTSAFTRFRHCRFTTTNATSSAVALTASSNTYICCSFSTLSTASQILTQTTNSAIFYGCYFSGANGASQAGITATTATLTFYYCTFNGCGAQGITSTQGTYAISNCTFNACGSDAIKWTGTPSGGGANNVNRIADTAFFKSGGYDINNASGTNTMIISLANNLSYSPSGTHLNGFGDWYEFGGTSVSGGAAAFVDSNDPRVSATDFHLLAFSLGCGAGIPGQWEGQTAGLTATPDVGAWQRQVLGPGAMLPFPG